MKLLDIKDPAALKAAVIALLDEQRSIYNGFLDKVPEAFKGDLTKLRDAIDGKLNELRDSPTQQVPAAGAAAGGLEHLAYMLAYMQEMYQSTTKGLSQLMETFAPKAQALHSLEARITAGELVEKEKAEKAQAEAVAQAVKAERDHQALLATRRQVLAAASLPLADEAILEGTDEAFKTVAEKAKTRLAQLEPMRQELDSAELAGLIYGNTDSQISLMLKVASKSGKKADPLVGGPGSAKVKIGF